MTKMSLYAFFATFALGMAAMVFSRNVFLGSEPAVAAPSAVSGISGADAGVGMDAFASVISNNLNIVIFYSIKYNIVIYY